MSNKNKNFIFLSILLIIITLACNIPAIESPNLEATITAQALLLQQGAYTATATDEPVVIVVTATLDPAISTSTVASTLEETVIPAAVVQVTAPSGAVTVTVSAATNCRTGPGQNFSSIYGMPIGQVAEVVAKNTYSGYWIIKIPNGNGTTCWLWGQYATVTGNTASLSEVVTPTSAATKKPPTATLKPTTTFTSTPILNKPASPSNLTITHKECQNDGNGTFNSLIVLTWQDNSNNETEFDLKVSTSDSIFSTIEVFPPNTTSANVTRTFSPGATVTIGISAQNEAGYSDVIEITTIVCQ